MDRFAIGQRAVLPHFPDADFDGANPSIEEAEVLLKSSTHVFLVDSQTESWGFRQRDLATADEMSIRP